MNIVLTGFMGTGKTSVGRLLAVKLRREFIDTDAVIVGKTGKSIEEIFSESGEPRFREIERDVIRRVSALDGKIISTGGGAVLDRGNTEALSSNGIIINLTSSPAKIYERLKNKTDRPLLKKPDVPGEIKKLLAVRESFYAACDYRINTDVLSPAAAAAEIMRFVASRGVTPA